MAIRLAASGFSLVLTGAKGNEEMACGCSESNAFVCYPPRSPHDPDPGLLLKARVGSKNPQSINPHSLEEGREAPSGCGQGQSPTGLRRSTQLSEKGGVGGSKSQSGRLPTGTA